MDLKTPTISVSEIFAMSDIELGHFIERHRNSDGGYTLPVHGWSELSEDERSRLREILLAQKLHTTQSPAAYSRPLNLDDLDELLRQIPTDTRFLRPSEQQPINQSKSSHPSLNLMIDEIEAYQKLIKDGGRPSYPIDLVHDVYQNPGSYVETLRPWTGALPETNAKDIFQRQLQEWQDFRGWQNENRDDGDDDIDFLAYVRSAKRRLRRHGFTHSLSLQKDPEKQNKLTTWVEYLNYEYWRLDEYTSDLKRSELEHEKSWQKLVESKMLKPYETKESVRTEELLLKTKTEYIHALKSVQRAKSKAQRIKDPTPIDSKRPGIRRVSTVKNGSDELLTASECFKHAQNKSRLVSQFAEAEEIYKEAMEDAASHRVLAQWVLDQVPLIEAEVSPPKGQARAKRRRTNDEDPLESRSTKKAKFDLQKPRLARIVASSKAKETRLKAHDATDRLTVRNSSHTNPASDSSHRGDAQIKLQSPRRSARIAARHNCLGIGHITQPRSRPRSKEPAAVPS